MKPEDLQLQTGTLLLMQLDPLSDERAIARVVGYQTNKSILTTMPLLGDRKVSVRRDQRITIRFLSKTMAYAFSTKIIHLCTQPYSYLHLAYPRKVVADEVRKAQRHNTQLEATFNAKEAGSPRTSGYITDISTTGLGLVGNDALGDKGDTIGISTHLPIAHIKRLLSLSGIIRSKNIERGELENYAYGIEFTELADEDFILISSYIHVRSQQD